MSELAPDDFEDAFPGNRSALSALRQSLGERKLVGFVGAGVSVPLAPAWTALLTELANEAADKSFITPEEKEFIVAQIADDPLEAATNIQDAFGRNQFREKLSRVFSFANKCTVTQEALVALPLDGVVTLNYDDGLSTAYVKQFGLMPNVSRHDNKFYLQKWSDGTVFQESFPILHWHGSAAAPEGIVITAEDYNQLYAKADAVQFVGDLWKVRNLLVVGFGFKDPFLTRIADLTMRDSASDNTHFALIGVEGGAISPLQRKTFSRKYRLNPIFYPIERDAAGRQDHSALVAILQSLAVVNESRSEVVDLPSLVQESVAANSSEEKAWDELRAGLYEAPNREKIYVEPRLLAPGGVGENGLPGDRAEVDLVALVSSGESLFITASFEFGASTLAKRLKYEYTKEGYSCFVVDAAQLPTYRKKLLDQDFAKVTGGKVALIIDDFDKVNNERLIKEVLGIDKADVIVLLQKASTTANIDVSYKNRDRNFVPLSLGSLRREDVRKIAAAIYDTYDSDLVSAAVEKTYNDLLGLCIPLTPANIIMYLNVIHKEGTFTPLNRLQIMDRYVRDRLHRPSDAYRDAFNTDNKLDIITSFVFWLFEREKTYFSKADWDKFCEAEMASSLDRFDKEMLLRDLLLSRIISFVSGLYHFKYKLFYSYFIGKYLGPRPALMPEFLEREAHLKIGSLVEMIAGSSKDNSALVSDLTSRLDKAIVEFEDQYGTAQLDPYASLEWAPSDDEEEHVWEPIAKRLSDGPASNEEVDKLKRSILAEERTEDQTVVIREFTGFERTVSFNQQLLIAALRESQRLDGALKLNAMRSIVHGYRIAMQIGFLFAPIIATRRYFVWNNVTFVNRLSGQAYASANTSERAALVAFAIPNAIVNRAADEIGSRKLGEVFKAMEGDSADTNFNKLMTYCALLRSRPEEWEKSAVRLLKGTDRKEAYLRYMLEFSVREFHQEVATASERDGLKKVVASIQVKRQLSRVKVSKGNINEAVKVLEESGYFDKD